MRYVASIVILFIGFIGFACGGSEQQNSPKKSYQQRCRDKGGLPYWYFANEGDQYIQSCLSYKLKRRVSSSLICATCSEGTGDGYIDGSGVECGELTETPNEVELLDQTEGTLFMCSGESLDTQQTQSIASSVPSDACETSCDQDRSERQICEQSSQCAVGLMCFNNLCTRRNDLIRRYALQGAMSCLLDPQTNMPICHGFNEHLGAYPPSTPFEAIYVNNNACGLMQNGNLLCWGTNNTVGQLQPPAGLWRSIAMSSRFTCGLKIDQTIACWGANDKAQLNAPTGQFSLVRTGARHACAIDLTGQIKCWGEQPAVWTPIPTNGPYVDLALSDLSNCALKKTGEVDCWGQMSDLPTVTGQYVQIVRAGNRAYCGLQNDGLIACWGASSSAANSAIINQIPQGQFVALIDSTSFWSGVCALEPSGKQVCWGATDLMTVNPSTLFSRYSLSGARAICGVTDKQIVCQRTQYAFPAGDYVDVAVSINHACGVGQFGQVVCNGRNDDGESNAPPVTSAKAIAVANSVSCALLQNGVRCWGSDDHGVVSNAPATGQFERLRVMGPVACAEDANSTVCWGRSTFSMLPTPALTSVSISNLSRCGLRADGSILCWDETMNAVDFAPNGSGFKELMVASGYGCAIDASDQIVCFGQSEDRAHEPPAGQYKSLQVASDVACAKRLSDDRLVCWGAFALNISGQLGLSSPCVPFAGSEGVCADATIVQDQCVAPNYSPVEVPGNSLDENCDGILE